ncbi:MAG TPA: septal ring lytic transglycosylase RlpA family protein [Thermoanaerobaculia bacterium]|nr:septal ring lytic transglycosylase RlpA family protein [Thermoanaerobaculia bacterium]
MVAPLALAVLAVTGVPGGYDFCPTLFPEWLVPPAEIIQPRRVTITGTASYYSDFFEGRKTASGTRFHHAELTAAHRTLPFGTVVEVKSRATGKSVRVTITDRGPFSGGFVIDLTKAAARAIGVDLAADRWVEITIIEEP